MNLNKDAEKKLRVNTFVLKKKLMWGGGSITGFIMSQM